MSHISCIYVTHPNSAQATSLCDTLLSERLIACSVLLPAESSYWWNGNIERSQEVVSILKTLPDKWESVKARISELHSYDVPCILKFDVEANEAYAAWVQSEVT